MQFYDICGMKTNLTKGNTTRNMRYILRFLKTETNEMDSNAQPQKYAEYLHSRERTRLQETKINEQRATRGMEEQQQQQQLKTNNN